MVHPRDRAAAGQEIPRIAVWLEAAVGTLPPIVARDHAEAGTVEKEEPRAMPPDDGERFVEVGGLARARARDEIGTALFHGHIARVSPRGSVGDKIRRERERN
jgi:hypothetical protein